VVGPTRTQQGGCPFHAATASTRRTPDSPDARYFYRQGSAGNPVHLGCMAAIPFRIPLESIVDRRNLVVRLPSCRPSGPSASTYLLPREAHYPHMPVQRQRET